MQRVKAADHLEVYHRWPPSPPRPGEKILIARDNALGELILTTPFLRHLRRLFPESTLSLLASPYAVDLFAKCPHLDEILVVKRKTSRRDYRNLVSDLLGEAYQLMFCPQETQPAAELGAWLGIPTRIGFDRKNNSQFLTRAIRAPEDVPKVLRLLHLLSPYCEDVRSLDRALELATDEEDVASARRFLQQSGADPARPLVGLGIGGHEYKRWALDRMAAVGRFLVQELGATCLVCAGPLEQRSEAQDVAREIGPHALLAYRRPLLEAAELIRRCRMMVANDSGLAWLTAAVETPAVILHRPSSCLAQYAPEGRQYLCLQAWYDPEDRSNRGLAAITVEQVIDAIGRLWPICDRIRT